jgi:hypothetical protein
MLLGMIDLLVAAVMNRNGFGYARDSSRFR